MNAILGAPPLTRRVARKDFERLKIIVRGAVQGVGFRPFVYRLAGQLGLTGWVSNSSDGVFIEVEGSRDALDDFKLLLTTQRPPRAVIQSLEASFLDPIGYDEFEIRESENAGEKTAFILPDIATCGDCLREIFDPKNRRFRYPFTNCTNCGPRFSIIEELPYDRSNMSMKKFQMCAECDLEYHDALDRRFHAQPNACPKCGPQLELWDEEENTISTRRGALSAAADAIRAGRILALKGLGGFQLIVDARNEAAVVRLRERKHREEKPFALMYPSLDAARADCEVSPLEERLLLSPEAPIVLVGRARRAGQMNGLPHLRDPCQLAESVAPGNPNLGVMLPYTPLHHLLMHELGFPIVATSGNVSDEPICIDEHEALRRLRGTADFFLTHDRPIVRHVDDSIVREMCGREMILRRARGYAPLPISVKSAISNQSEILAVGAHLKNTVALKIGDNIFVSQHIGDLETEQAYGAFQRSVRDLPRLYDAKIIVVACDMHPDYLSSKFAHEMISDWGAHAPSRAVCGAQPQTAKSNREPALQSEESGAARLDLDFSAKAPKRAREARALPIQHHYAHVAACMAENEIDPPVLGVAWDGTGYGLDGTIWGGEFLLAKPGGSFERVAHFRQFRLPGGDRAIKEPRRSALGLLYEIFGDDVWNFRKLIVDLTEKEKALLRQMLVKKINAPLTSSVGRLFDAVAAIVGLRTRSSFEGQAAMELEFTRRNDVPDAYSFMVRTGRPMIVDWEPAVRELLDEVSAKTDPGVISAKFHSGLVEAVVDVAKKTGEQKIILSGGCFQNRYLIERTVEKLREEKFQPYWHQRIPPNDGGIALGQAVAASWKS